MKKGEIELKEDSVLINGRVVFEEGDDYYIGVTILGRTNDWEEFCGERTKLKIYAVCWDKENRDCVSVYDYDEIITIKDIDDHNTQLLIDKINFYIRDAKSKCLKFLKNHK